MGLLGHHSPDYNVPFSFPRSGKLCLVFFTIVREPVKGFTVESVVVICCDYVSYSASSSVEMFKANLENLKKDSSTCSESNFWDVSRVLLDKIEGPSYVESKERHNAYLIENPYVARKRNINTYRS